MLANFAARGLSLMDSLIGPAWSRKERTGHLPVVRFSDLGLVDTVDEADIFRDHDGKLVLNGATCVPKVKLLPDSSTVELQRFVSNLV